MGSTAEDMATLGMVAKIAGLGAGLLGGVGAVIGTGLFLTSMS